jgi:hypothetical protein
VKRKKEEGENKENTEEESKYGTNCATRGGKEKIYGGQSRGEKRSSQGIKERKEVRGV